MLHSNVRTSDVRTLGRSYVGHVRYRFLYKKLSRVEIVCVIIPIHILHCATPVLERSENGSVTFSTIELPNEYLTVVNTFPKDKEPQTVWTSINRGTLFDRTIWIDEMVECFKRMNRICKPGRPKKEKYYNTLY